MKFRAFIGLALFLLFVTSTTQATTTKTSVEQLIAQASKLHLSQHAVWQKLLHYKKSYLSYRQSYSEINDKSFFISSMGSTDPTVELEATIQAFFLPVAGIDINEHAQCKFPARFIWLKKELNINNALIKNIHCPKYYEWTQNNTIESVSIVYASGYLGNPASYYGHLLLKLNSNNPKLSTKLLAPSISYGAAVPPNENPFIYMFKGVLGGYDGSFSHTDYYFHSHNYGELELRNLWEYSLNLNPDEVDFIVAHAWELEGRRFTYYFFRKNCAYRLAELLEIINGVNIIPANPFYVLPRALLQNITDSDNDRQESLVHEIAYRPSRQARFYEKFNHLTSNERNEVVTALNDSSGEESSNYSSLTTGSKINVKDTLIDYYQFAKVSDILPKEIANNLHRKVIKERFLLPINKNISADTSKKAPHNGRKSSYVNVSPAYNDSLGSGVSLLIRPAYYDALDASSGHVADSALSMGELKLFITDNDISIRHIDFLKIESISSSYSDVPDDKGESWKIKFGIRQKDLACSGCLMPYLEGDYGITTRLTPNILVGAYAGGGIQDNRKGSGKAYLKASFITHLKLTDSLNMRLRVEAPRQLFGAKHQSNYYLVEARQRLSVNTDLRFMYEKDNAEEYSISFGYYF